MQPDLDRRLHHNDHVKLSGAIGRGSHHLSQQRNVVHDHGIRPGLVDQLLGFPRHLSQHVGGLVITRGPLCELTPIENAAMPAGAGRVAIDLELPYAVVGEVEALRARTGIRVAYEDAALRVTGFAPPDAAAELRQLKRRAVGRVL